MCVLLGAFICAALTQLSLYPVKSLHRHGSPGGEIHISKPVTAAQLAAALPLSWTHDLSLNMLQLQLVLHVSFCLTETSARILLSSLRLY